MSSDIQPGDVVVCVDARPYDEWVDDLGPCYTRPLAVGRHYRVTDLIPPDADCGGWGVKLAEVPDWWDIDRFRKLNDEPDNAELIARIRACKPVKEPVLSRTGGEA